MMPMMLAQEASIIDIIGVPFLLPKPSGAVLVSEAVLAGAPIGPACKMAPARMLMILSRRAAWNAQKPSLCWGFPTKTRVFGTLAALCACPLLLRSRPFMAAARFKTFSNMVWLWAWGGVGASAVGWGRGVGGVGRKVGGAAWVGSGRGAVWVGRGGLGWVGGGVWGAWGGVGLGLNSCNTMGQLGGGKGRGGEGSGEGGGEGGGGERIGA